ncbi:MAG: glycosyltransferase family 1 protein [Lachnospiraceae bacterium]|nr:glycosyltransferase family 1 protein [Lachnospiraceae bacterium]
MNIALILSGGKAIIAYYLAHEEERRQIAENGHRKIEEQHTYRHRVREMLSCL